MFGAFTCVVVGFFFTFCARLVYSSTTNVFPTYIAGYYVTGESVEEHAEIDLDVQNITGAFKSGSDGFTYPNNKKIHDSTGDTDSCDAVMTNQIDRTYTFGGNSKTAPPYRTLKGFSTTAGAKASETVGGNSYGPPLRTEKWYFERLIYWRMKDVIAENEYDFGNKIVDAAINGASIYNADNVSIFNFGGSEPPGDDFRVEAVQKGIVYQNVFNYVIWEMQDAINDCEVLVHSNPGSENAVHAWDEAVAFYTGSLEGGAPGGKRVVDGGYGQLLYALAEKRACQDGNFYTCTGLTAAGVQFSQVNENIFRYFSLGQTQINNAFISGDSKACAAVEETKDAIVRQMLVPLFQGALRYMYKCRGGFASDGCEAKEAGELFAFASAILPHVHEADPGVAEQLYQIAWKFSSFSFPTMKARLESTYPEVGIKCSDVGALPSDTNPDYGGVCYDAASYSDDDSDTVLRLGLGMGLGLGVPLLSIAACALYFYHRNLEAYKKLDEYAGVSLNQESQLTLDA